MVYQCVYHRIPPSYTALTVSIFTATAETIFRNYPQRLSPRILTFGGKPWSLEALTFAQGMARSTPGKPWIIANQNGCPSGFAQYDPWNDVRVCRGSRGN